MSERLPNASLPVRTSPHDMFLHTVDRHSSPFGPTSECLPNVFRFGPTSESLPNIFWINFLFWCLPFIHFLICTIPYPFPFGCYPFIYLFSANSVFGYIYFLSLAGILILFS